MIKITIEGPAGSGKSTMSRVIFDALAAHKDANGYEETVSVVDASTDEQTGEMVKVLGVGDATSDVLIVVKEAA